MYIQQHLVSEWMTFSTLIVSQRIFSIFLGGKPSPFSKASAPSGFYWNIEYFGLYNIFLNFWKFFNTLTRLAELHIVHSGKIEDFIKFTLNRHTIIHCRKTNYNMIQKVTYCTRGRICLFNVGSLIQWESLVTHLKLYQIYGACGNHFLITKSLLFLH